MKGDQSVYGDNWPDVRTFEPVPRPEPALRARPYREVRFDPWDDK